MGKHSPSIYLAELGAHFIAASRPLLSVLGLTCRESVRSLCCAGGGRKGEQCLTALCSPRRFMAGVAGPR